MTSSRPGDRIAVTGASGFVGQKLVELLVGNGYQVIGISERPDAPPVIEGLLTDYISMDLTRGWPDIGPIDGMVHLAGLAAVGPSFEHPQEYLNVNSSMVTNFFEHAVATEWTGRAIVVSSGAVYGSVGESANYFSEDSPPVANSPYVVSKLLIERQVEYYSHRGIDALIARPFNHIGPGQGPGFVVPDLTTKLRAWQPGSELTVGNLDSARDYTDVRDIANAYLCLLEHRNPSYAIYNVCSGTSHSGWFVFESICAALGIPVPPTKVENTRAIDPQAITGNAARLQQDAGWKPAISVQTSIADFVAASAV